MITSAQRQQILSTMLPILVLYKSSLDQSRAFVSLTESLRRTGLSMHLFVYDNSPSLIKNDFGKYEQWKIEYVHNPSNPGVSAAYNEGARVAQHLDKKWLLLLDQDTTFPPDAFAGYCASIFEYQEEELFAPSLICNGKIWSPCHYRLVRGFHANRLEHGKNSLHGRALSNSGICVSLNTFQRAGGYNEKIDLYFADYAFIDRLRKHLTSFVLIPIECNHGVSDVQDSDIETALPRFTHFCENARDSAQSFKSCLLLSFWVFLHGLRLSFLFRSFRFYPAFWRYFLSRKVREHH